MPANTLRNCISSQQLKTSKIFSRNVLSKPVISNQNGIVRFYRIVKANHKHFIILIFYILDSNLAADTIVISRNNAIPSKADSSSLIANLFEEFKLKPITIPAFLHNENAFHGNTL